MRKRNDMAIWESQLLTLQTFHQMPHFLVLRATSYLWTGWFLMGTPLRFLYSGDFQQFDLEVKSMNELEFASLTFLKGLIPLLLSDPQYQQDSPCPPIHDSHIPIGLPSLRCNRTASRQGWCENWRYYMKYVWTTWMGLSMFLQSIVLLTLT